MISVIVPIYNVEKYLCRCIESVINQTYTNLQIILVDDGSPDKCGEICDRYAKKDSRITVIHQKNKGVAAARNVGLEIAVGEYVGFVDPDDYIDSQMYEVLINGIEMNNSEMGICAFQKVYQEKTEEFEQGMRTVEFLERNRYEVILGIFGINTDFGYRPSVCNKLFLRELIGKERFDQTIRVSEDLLFLIRYLGNVEKAYITNMELYKNMVRNNSATHGGLSVEEISTTVDSDEKMLKIVREICPQAYAKVLSWVIQDNMGWYSVAKNKTEKTDLRLKEMKRKLLKKRFKVLSNRETYWKTRIAYFIGRI